jgi:chemotaxis protein CheD
LKNSDFLVPKIITISKKQKTFMKETIVDVADMRISKSLDEILVAPSLGSCVALSVYDPEILVGGILIFMLPEMADVTFPGADQFVFMFADTGIPAFLEAAKKSGMVKKRLQVVLAGGGQITGQNESFNIGHRNGQTAKQLLLQTGLHIQTESLGGVFNRTLHLELASGKTHISNAGQEALSI